MRAGKQKGLRVVSVSCSSLGSFSSKAREVKQREQLQRQQRRRIGGRVSPRGQEDLRAGQEFTLEGPGENEPVRNE